MRDFWLPFLLSAGAGVLSGWGVGGGTLLLVGLTLLLGVEQRQAQAVNLLFFLVSAALTILFHRKNDLVDKTVWVRAAIPGTAASLLGALAALAVDAELLRKPFGIFLLASAALMLRSSSRENS